MNRRMFLPGLALAVAGGNVRAAQPTMKKPVAEGSNQFAAELYGKLSKEEGNLFFSPFSISTALGMTSVGARGQTLEQMVKTLHLPPDQAETNRGFAELMKSLNAEGSDPAKRGYELSVANALWGQQGASWEKSFRDTTEKFYGAGLHQVDFARATEAARQTINGWVEKQTRDKIKDLIAKDVLQPDTQLVLTNAIYFKGKWAVEFSKKATNDELFFTAPEKSAKVPMMHIRGGYGYYEDADLQALEMPYKGNELAMVVFLPKKKDGLAALEKSLTPVNLAKWVGGLRYTETVIVTLPRFKMTSEFSLAKQLASMGMKDLFSMGADLSGMRRDGGLFISDAIHKAFVEVNEEGTEAAAATAIIARPTAAAVNPRPIPVFRADHPFAFTIRDRRNGSVLFMGRVADPAK
jgi:serpin B